MSIEKDLEQDVGQFFQEIEKMLPEGKKKHLKILIDKYCHLLSTPIIFDKYDLDMIKDLALRQFIDKTARVYMGKNRREVTDRDIVTLRVVEATIGYLHSKDCLKKLPKFDYKNE